MKKDNKEKHKCAIIYTKHVNLPIKQLITTHQTISCAARLEG